eukprot:TRINITY_DN21692_c0_g1_i1.p1 TRINITY_DN21692_c0_g1~~TRINITY_DN21692_c0_g1_i1.p1  ORF type:complete len:200 (+),score=6.85 TRINITY_DN21692_c0_g1_i1:169-768(+)
MDPGYIPVKTKASVSSHEEDSDRYCAICNIYPRPLRARHCYQCRRCVYRHDHHCAWTDNCIGKASAPVFFLFLLAQLLNLSNGMIMAITDLFTRPYPPFQNEGEYFTRFAAVCFFTYCLFAITAMLLTYLVLHSNNMLNNITTSEYRHSKDLPYITLHKHRRGPAIYNSRFSKSLWHNIRVYFNFVEEDTNQSTLLRVV